MSRKFLLRTKKVRKENKKLVVSVLRKNQIHHGMVGEIDHAALTLVKEQQYHFVAHVENKSF